MNVLKCTVVEVLGEPVRHVTNHPEATDGVNHEYYTVAIKYDCWGSVTTTDLVFNTLESAKEVKVGSTFNA